MDTRLAPLDWSLLQSFCAVAREGSLSAAARKLEQSQPTIGRHVKLIEQALGMELFRRVPRGLELTESGLEILPYAEAMEQSAARLRLAAEGRAEDLSGTVRITASVVMSHFILPTALAGLRRDYPEIQIELVPSDATENLIFREADIAVRMYKPEQPDVITRHVADIPIGLYAAKSYLDRTGRPQDVDDFLHHAVVGFDKSDIIIRLMAGMGLSVGREFFPVRCDNQAVHWQLVRAGCGIGGMQTIIGDADPVVERVLPELVLPALPVWLVAPTALRASPRIRRVWDRLAKTLSEAVS